MNFVQHNDSFLDGTRLGVMPVCHCMGGWIVSHLVVLNRHANVGSDPIFCHISALADNFVFPNNEKFRNCNSHFEQGFNGRVFCVVYRLCMHYTKSSAFTSRCDFCVKQHDLFVFRNVFDEVRYNSRDKVRKSGWFSSSIRCFGPQIIRTWSEFLIVR